nr:unnamed protein product [Digitaria exilis]
MVVVGSADSFASILSKVQDEKLPAVFYYTAVWCGPCQDITEGHLTSMDTSMAFFEGDNDLSSIFRIASRSP